MFFAHNVIVLILNIWQINSKRSTKAALIRVCLKSTSLPFFFLRFNRFIPVVSVCYDDFHLLRKTEPVKEQNTTEV